MVYLYFAELLLIYFRFELNAENRKVYLSIKKKNDMEAHVGEAENQKM